MSLNTLNQLFGFLQAVQTEATEYCAIYAIFFFCFIIKLAQYGSIY